MLASISAVSLSYLKGSQPCLILYRLNGNNPLDWDTVLIT